MFSKPPRLIEAGTLDTLAALVPHDQYRIVTDASQLPPEIANYTGTNFLCAVIAGTSCVQNSDSPYAANGNVWWVKLFRNCMHDGTPHYNADMRILYEGVDGLAWIASSHENPDHYLSAFSGTTLCNARIAANLPENDVGELDKLGYQSMILDASKMWPDFKMPYWSGSNDEKNL